MAAEDRTGVSCEYAHNRRQSIISRGDGVVKSGGICAISGHPARRCSGSVSEYRLLAKVLEKYVECSTAVIEGAAVGRGKLRHGLVEGGHEEEGIIAKSACASRSGEDIAIDGAIGSVQEFAIAGEGEGTAITGLSA